MKLNRCFKIWFTMVAILVIICATSACGNPVSRNPADEEKGFYIEYITPDLVRVVSLEINYIIPFAPDNIHKSMGNGDSFSKAVRQLSEDYVIGDIIPINYLYGFGSFTAELWVKVRPKK